MDALAYTQEAVRFMQDRRRKTTERTDFEEDGHRERPE
jgi:hypothetical protein